MPAVLRTASAFVLVAAASAFWASAASAHEAASGWKYDNYCCGGNDCQPIPIDDVKITPEGYEVSIPQGGHITAKRDHKKLFRYGEVRESQDDKFHACILPNSQEFRCLYVPPFGT